MNPCELLEEKIGTDVYVTMTDKDGDLPEIKVHIEDEFLGLRVRIEEDDYRTLVERLPHYKDFQRAYLTIAIGCTGGQHRSVYIAEAVAVRLADAHGRIRIRHNELPQPDSLTQ